MLSFAFSIRYPDNAAKTEYAPIAVGPDVASRVTAAVEYIAVRDIMVGDCLKASPMSNVKMRGRAISNQDKERDSI